MTRKNNLRNKARRNSKERKTIFSLKRHISYTAIPDIVTSSWTLIGGEYEGVR